MPTALITGATEGIGRATSFALAAAGYAVGVTARTRSAVDMLAKELRDRGYRAYGHAADVGDPTQVDALVGAVERELGPVDALINNAGIAPSKAVGDTTVEEWDQVFATNVRGVFLMTKSVLAGMRARKRGDIVNVASLAGKNGVAYMAAYSASKHAVLGFSRSLMLEVRKEGVRVIAICPGSVDTPLLRGQTAFSPNYDRILQPEEIATTIVDVLKLPQRAMVSELDIRPANP